MILSSYSKMSMFGNTKASLKDKHRVLEELTSMNDLALLERIQETKAKINNMLHQEEVAWHQRSKAIWLPVGDKNTKFFTKEQPKESVRIGLWGVFDTAVDWCIDEGQIADIAMEYF